MANKKKAAPTVVAVATAAALLLGGTFAWQSISQTALNEASDVINPGGRLHNDLWYEDAKTANNDIYVENFAEDEIFARVRLSEYMEIVMNYGSAAEKVENVAGSKTLKDGTGGEDAATAQNQYDYEYDIHYFHDVDGDPNTDTNATDKYWEWTTGSEDSVLPYYMPTFNLNKDSLAPDLNGLYAKRVGGISNREMGQYVDVNGNTLENYEGYTDGEPMTGYEIYDGDTNSSDEIGTDPLVLADIIANGTDQYDENIVLTGTPVGHDAQPVGETKGMMSLTDWLAMVEADDGEYDEALHGGYWVYDDTEDVDGDGTPDGDGWVYWSSPIAGKDNAEGKSNTTGLLLDSFTLNEVMDDTWYYAIEVKGQFITADDLGFNPEAVGYNMRTASNTDEEELPKGTGFYADGETVTPNALELLYLIGVGRDSSNENDGEGEEEENKIYDVVLAVLDEAPNTPSADDYLLYGQTRQLYAYKDYDENGNPISLQVSNWELVVDEEYEPYNEGTTITSDGKLTVAKDEMASFIQVSATVTEGEYAGKYFTTAIYPEDPWIDIIEVNEDGEKTEDYGNITPGKSSYYKVEGIYIYGLQSNDQGVDATYPGYSVDELTAEDISWSVNVDAPFSMPNTITDTYDKESKIYKVTHTCADAENCACAVSLVIRAELANDPRAGGFTTRFIYEDDTVDTMNLYVTCCDENWDEQSVLCTSGNEPNTVELKVNPYDPHIGFELGEAATGSLIWMDEDGNDLADHNGWIDGASIDGVSNLMAFGFELDPDERIETLTLIGRYDPTSDHKLSADTRITLNFTFVWVEEDSGWEEEDYNTISVAIENDLFEVEQGKSYTLTAYGYECAKESLIWSVENSALSTVEGNGDTAVLNVHWAETAGYLDIRVEDSENWYYGTITPDVIALKTNQGTATLYSDGNVLTDVETGESYSGLSVKVGDPEAAATVTKWSVIGNTSSGTSISADGDLSIGYFENSANLKVLATVEGESAPYAFTLNVTKGVSLTDISDEYILARINDKNTGEMVASSGEYFPGTLSDKNYVVNKTGFEDHETTIDSMNNLKNLKACELVGTNLNALRLTGSFFDGDVVLGISDGTEIIFRTCDMPVEEKHSLYVITEDNKYIKYDFTVTNDFGE